MEGDGARCGSEPTVRAWLRRIGSTSCISRSDRGYCVNLASVGESTQGIFVPPWHGIQAVGASVGLLQAGGGQGYPGSSGGVPEANGDGMVDCYLLEVGLLQEDLGP